MNKESLCIGCDAPCRSIYNEDGECWKPPEQAKWNVYCTNHGLLETLNNKEYAEDVVVDHTEQNDECWDQVVIFKK